MDKIKPLQRVSQNQQTTKNLEKIKQSIPKNGIENHVLPSVPLGGRGQKLSYLQQVSIEQKTLQASLKSADISEREFAIALQNGLDTKTLILPSTIKPTQMMALFSKFQLLIESADIQKLEIHAQNYRAELDLRFIGFLPALSHVEIKDAQRINKIYVNEEGKNPIHWQLTGHARQKVWLIPYPVSSLLHTSQVPDSAQPLPNHFYLHNPNRSESLNGQATFADGAPIVCEALAGYWLSNKLHDSQEKKQKSEEKENNIFAVGLSLPERGNRKLSYDAVSTKEKIEQTILGNDQNLITKSEKNLMVLNSQFGEFIASRIEKLKETVDVEKADKEKKTSSELFLLNSTGHAMALEIQVQYIHKKWHYITKFYDPNLTLTHVQVSTTHLDDVKQWRFEQFLAEGQTTIPCEKEKMIMLRSYAVNGKAQNAVKSDAQRTLEWFIDDENQKILPAAICHLLKGNLWQPLLDRDYKKLFENLSSAELFESLMAKDVEGIPAICFVFDKDSVQTFDALRQLLTDPGLLKKLNSEQLFELLSAKEGRGVPPFYLSQLEGNTESMKIFGKLLSDSNILKKLHKHQLFELLAAKDPNNDPALYYDFQGLAQSIDTLGAIICQPRILRKLNNAQLVELLAAKNVDGMPGLYQALLMGETEVIEVFGALLKNPGILKKLHTEQLLHLLEARYENFSGLQAAKVNKHTYAIEAFNKIINDPAILKKLSTEIVS